MKDCEKYKILIDELADGEISDNNRLELSAHMKDCLECSIVYEQTLTFKEKMKKIPSDVKPPHTVWNRINEKITEDNIEVKQVAGNFFTIVNTAQDTAAVQPEDEPKKGKSYLKYVIAACVVVFLGLISIPFIYRADTDNPDATAFAYWHVTKVKGAPVINDGAKSIASFDSLKAGDWIETDDSSKAIITIAGLGEITVEPKSKVKILNSEKGEHKVLLEYGTINTNFSQKSEKFSIETKNSIAWDNNPKGTAYTFSVDNKGDGMILVKDGSVLLESRGKESVVPAGKICLVQASVGPGTPFSVNASAEFRNALYTYDFEPGNTNAIYNVINTANNSDMISLINLIPRVNDDMKEQIYSKVSGVVAPPTYIIKDSLRYFDCEKLGEWIEKCQEQVWQNVEKNLEGLDERIRIKIEKNMGDNFDVKVFTEELNKEIEENLKDALKNLDMSKEMIEKQKEQFKSKNWNFNFSFPDSFKSHFEMLKDGYNYNYEFDSEEFKQEMKNLEEELKNNQEEWKIDQEQLMKDLDDAQQEIDEAKEEIRRELEQMREEQRKEQEELREEQRREREEQRQELEEQPQENSGSDI
ncbi:MAG TPA: hypothetical protein VHP32_11570 [Ignavibacteria bacterium]|nr:hypothetical protein [Ignavibacteria bacterium]